MKMKDVLNESYDMEEDEYMIRQMSDTRRPKLTIRHLNKLRKLKDVRRMENSERNEFVKIMYSAGSSSDEPEF